MAGSGSWYSLTVLCCGTWRQRKNSWIKQKISILSRSVCVCVCVCEEPVEHLLLCPSYTHNRFWMQWVHDGTGEQTRGGWTLLPFPAELQPAQWHLHSNPFAAVQCRTGTAGTLRSLFYQPGFTPELAAFQPWMKPPLCLMRLFCFNSAELFGIF